ncbi:MAG: hypothetical protein KAR42_06380 [candidate division Zixibacteria bacterium]|nr:hypothetical protein [candidate division Zixibacteria bacterium]
MDIKTYIDDLFRYLDTFENKSTEFETEAFLQTYNGIYAVFQAFRKQRDKAIEVDQYFLQRIQKEPLTSSVLRQLTIQVLITFFESEADIDGQSNKSYLYCRDLRASKRDIAYFEEHLLPLLFRDGGLNNNFRLNSFFLSEIGRYLNKFGRDVNAGLSPEAFESMSVPQRFLELMRRRLSLGPDLLSDRNSLEFHLHRVDAFSKLSGKSGVGEQYLKKWNYLKTTSFWDKVTGALSEIGGKIKGTFASFTYFKLVITQRTAAFFWYSVIALFFVFLSIYVPMKWVSYSDEKLEQFNNKAAVIQRGGK